jgi:hypothetical protein
MASIKGMINPFMLNLSFNRELVYAYKGKKIE